MGFDFSSLTETEEEKERKRKEKELALGKPIDMPIIDTQKTAPIKVDFGSFVMPVEDQPEEDKIWRIDPKTGKRVHTPDWKRQAGVGYMPTKREFYNAPDWAKDKDIPEIGEAKAGLFDILEGVVKKTGKELVLDLPKKLVSGAVGVGAGFLETGGRFAEKSESYKMNQRILRNLSEGEEEGTLGENLSKRLRDFEKKIDEDRSITMHPFAQKFAKTIGGTAVDLLVMKQYIKGAGGVIAKIMKGKNPKLILNAINKWAPGIGMAFYGALDGASHGDVKQAITGGAGGFAMGKLHGVMRIIKPKVANIAANVWGFSSIAAMQHLIDTGELPNFLGDEMLQTYMLGYAFELIGGKKRTLKKELKPGDKPPSIKDITKPKVPETLPEMGEPAKEVRTTSELKPVEIPVKEIVKEKSLLETLKESKKTVPEFEVYKEKENVKKQVYEEIKKGTTGVVRFTNVGEIKNILQKGKMPDRDIHAQPIRGKDTVLEAYGNNKEHSAAILVPEKYIIKKPDAHTSEAYIDPNVPIGEIKFFFGTQKKSLTRIEIASKLKSEMQPVKPIKEIAAEGEKGFVELTIKDLEEIKRELPHEMEAKKLYDEISKALKPGPLKRVKILLHKATGFVKVKDLIEIDTGEALRVSLRRAAKAFREGNKAGVELQKKRIAVLKLKQQQRKELTAKIEELKKINTDKMPDDQANAVKELISDFDLVKLTEKKRLRLTKSIEFFRDNPENTNLPDYLLKDIERLDKTPIRDLTSNDFDSVYTAIKHHTHVAKRIQIIKVGLETHRRGTVKEAAVKEMKPEKQIRADLLSKPQGKFNRLKETGTLIKDTFGIRQESYNLIVESIAGKNSTTDKVLFKALDKGTDIELKYSQDISENFQKDIKGIDIKNGRKWLKKTVTTDNLKLTHNERMALYRHSINAKNRASLLEGGFYRTFSNTPDKLFKITEAQLNKIINSLTKQELAYASEPVTNFYKNEYNKENPIFVEKNGYSIPYEENYYPAEKRGALKERIESDKYLRIGLSQGRFKAKVDTKLPINLNPLTYDLNKSMRRAGAYVGYEIPLNNASKLLRDIKTEIESRYGKQTYIELDKGLRDIVGEYKTYTTTEKLLMRGKNKLATVFLGLNPFVIAKQPLSFFLYSHYVKPQFLMMGIIDSIWHPRKTIEGLKSNSPKAKERFTVGYSRDVADVFKGGSEKRFYGGGKTLAEKTMGGIKWGDRRAVVPGMQGAVRQVLYEFKKGKLSREVKRGLDMQDSDIAKLTPGQQMQLAYEYADYATGRSQPMFLPAYRSSLSRGTPVEKLGTMFGSFTNQALNETKRNFRDAIRSGDPQAYTKLAKTIVSIYILNTLAVMGIDEVRNKLYKREKDEGVVGKVASTWAGYMFFMRDLVRSAVSKIERGTYRGYDPELPISRIPDLMTDIIGHGAGMFTKEGKRKDKSIMNFVDDSVELLLMGFGIPYETPKKIIKAVTEPNADKIKRLEKEKKRLERERKKLRNKGSLTFELDNKFKDRLNKIEQQIQKYSSGAS